MGVKQEEALRGVTSEWRTTAEIVARVPRDDRIAERTHRLEVYYGLWMLLKNGLVERRPAPREGRGGKKVVEWRLVQ